MNGHKKETINHLLKSWPQGTVAIQRWLTKQGIYRQLAQKYVQYGWLKKIARGAFLRFEDTLVWQGALYTLQHQHGLTVHPGALSALELHGRAHYVPLGGTPKLHLYSDKYEQLPKWFTQHPWNIAITHTSAILFDHPVTNALSNVQQGNTFSILVSSAERAIMEVMYKVANSDDLKNGLLLMEGLTTLRPSLVQNLLSSCRSIKTKRLFLWAADTCGHDWFKHLSLDQINLGTGKRGLFQGAQFDPKYLISIPKDKTDA